MRFTETAIVGVWVIDPDFRADERGRFFRAWCSQEFAEHGINFKPVQANMGLSTRKGTVGGMHFQIEPAVEAKLVRCTRGAIFDVALDLRAESPTYGKQRKDVVRAREMWPRLSNSSGRYRNALHGVTVLYSRHSAGRAF